MRRAASSPRSDRRSRLPWLTGLIVTALIAVVAIVSQGYDARETPRLDPSVWVTREDGQYARVNTETWELDTVRRVAEPTSVIQAGENGAILTHGNGRAWPVDPAYPADFRDDDAAPAGDPAAPEADPGEEEQEAPAVEPVRMPDGAREIITAGVYVLVRTESGGVYLGQLGAEAGSAPLTPEEITTDLSAFMLLDPYADSEDGEEEGEGDSGGQGSDGPTYSADAVALDAEGRIAMYSGADGRITRFDARQNAFAGSGEDLPPAARDLPAAQLTLAGGQWVLFNPETGELWRRGEEAVRVNLTGTGQLQASSPAPEVLVADAAGLWQVHDGAAQRIADADGVPAQPVDAGGTRYAAWLGQQAGLLWSSAEEERSLTFDPSVQDPGELAPVFRTNGTRAVLSEAQTGMLWTLPEGRLIPLSQWSISEPPKEDRGSVVVDEVAEQVPPTAVDDEFGVRAGEPAPLPVLLNDYDPNRRDILTIVPESLEESPLSEEFGTLHLLPDAQSLTVHPLEGASGSATFTYRITDGSAISDPATVTLSVAGEETNTPPDWCPVQGCQREWAVPAIVPGGTLVHPVLEGWVDPEGDPLVLAGAQVVREEDPARAVVTSDGRLAVSHTDPSAEASEVLLRLRVQDSRGAEQHRDLQVPIRPDAHPEFIPTATTIQTGEPATLRPLERISGGSGSFELIDASIHSGSDTLTASPRPTTGTVVVSATEAGSTVLSLTFRDTGTDTEFTGLARVSALAGAPPLTLPPLRGFVRPLADATIEVLDAIPGADARALSVQDVIVDDGDLRAEVVDHARVRVAGSTPDGRSGRIGSATVRVTDGNVSAATRLTVFQVPETGAGGAIAVADTAVVRAGSVVDIPVLDNDVAPPGERLILHPDVTGTGAEGELAFASGNVLRYLAPNEPGTYRLSYTVYASNAADDADVGTVVVTVLPPGANADPRPGNLTMRLGPGERAEARVPLSGVDPDGDRVRLVAVGEATDPQVSVSISASGDRIEARALELAEEGLHTVSYTVQDDYGGTGTATVRIIVAAPAEDARAPVVSTDHVRLVHGAAAPAVVRPLDNDLDPAGGELEIVSLTPSLVGGQENPDYQAMMDRLDLSGLEQGVVRIEAGADLGTDSYQYTVKSDASSSTADGLILVHTTERVGAQAPDVLDTVVNVRDRGVLASEGIDVISNKVRWATGDVSALRLSLWGAGDGYRVEENRIFGEYRPGGDVVVFEVSGPDSTGATITSYGLLIIPSLDDLRITTKPGSLPLHVDENEAVETPIQTLLDLGPDDAVELPEQVFPTGRAAARCEGLAGNTLRYDAGAEAPWADTCLIDVRLVGQSRWTELAVPITIRPREPLVELAPLTRTITAGASETIDLLDMVRWEGEREGDVAALHFEVLGEPSIFTLERAGTALTVTARADAEPGAQRGMTITATGQGEASASLTLRVGEAPRDNPRGATVALSCEIGTDCSAQVVGVGGEHDPFAGKAGGGLRLESVESGACSYGHITRADDQHVRVTWPEETTSGGTCTVGFTVKDAQGRLGEGKIELDALGTPLAPAALTWNDYTADSISLVVDLGGAQRAHPAITGIEISGPGTSSCSASGASYVCTVTDVALGAKAEYTARAVNAIGSSEPTRAVTAWAYQAPERPELTIAQRETPDNTATDRGRISISAKSSADAGRIHITWGGSGAKTIDSAAGTVPDFDIAAGSHTFTAVAESRFDTPPIKSASPRGNETVTEFAVAGAPSIESVTLHSTGEREGTIEAGGVSGNGAKPQLSYGLAEGRDGPAECTQSGPVFPDRNRFSAYTPKVCVQTPYGRDEKTGKPARIGGKIPALTGQTYEVSTSHKTVDGRKVFELTNARPVEPTVQGREVWVEYSSGDRIVLDAENASPDQIQVRQCKKDWLSTECSEWATMAPVSGTPPTIVHVTQQPGECVVPGDQDTARAAVGISGGAASSADVGAPGQDGRFTIRWTGAFSSLQSVEIRGEVCPEPEPDPEPDPPEPDPPDPEPEPDPAPDPPEG